MIHFLTYGNFGVLDPRIEAAYRRRHVARRCARRRRTADDLVMCGAKERVYNGGDWLRQLATDVETLARVGDSTARPPTRKKSRGERSRAG
jgi:hypothetical protein